MKLSICPKVLHCLIVYKNRKISLNTLQFVFLFNVWHTGNQVSYLKKLRFLMCFFLAFPWGTYNKMHVLWTYVRLIWLKMFLFLTFNHAYMHVNYNFKWVKIRVRVFIFYIVLLLVSIHDHKKSNTIKCVHINKVIKMGENPENTLVKL